MHTPEQKLLVIGCGSGLAGNQAVGAHLVTLLAAAHRNGTRFLAMDRAGLELLDVFEREDRIVFVDAITSGRKPGTIVLTPLPSDEVLQTSTAREGWGLNEVLALARSLGRRIPQTMLLGIEVEKDDAPLLSEAAARATNFVLDNFDDLKPLISARELLVLEADPAHA